MAAPPPADDPGNMARQHNAARRLPELAPAGAPANDHPQPEGAHPVPALPADAQVTLAMLVLLFGKADGGCRATHLDGRDEGELHADGAQYDSQRVLDGAVAVVVSTTRILGSLTPEQMELVTLDPAVLGVIVEESARLQDMLARHRHTSVESATARTARDAECAACRRAAITQRDVVRVGLAQALGAGAVEGFAPARDASDDAALAGGLDFLAGRIEAAFKGGAEATREQLTRRGLGPARARRLRALAAQLRETSVAPTFAPPPAVGLRELNVQDGRVLALVDAVVDAMRAAHRANRAIALPSFGPLARRYRTGRRRKATPDAPPAPPAPPR